jgi:UDP-N-acetylglucosamine 2-epimerase (non-hydrolysing)
VVATRLQKELHVLHVVGARPNFMKAAPVVRALSNRDGIRQSIVHTGQHYDEGMSAVFFRELAIPQPDVNLEVGSGSHAVQTAETMKHFEPVLLERKPDLVLVYGDVNSTVAAALVCAKRLVPVGHVEAGLRSFDRTMPEEINRLLTDQMADLLFTPSEDGDANLLREGVAAEKVHFVGNVMIDTLCASLPAAEARWPVRGLKATLGSRNNVDDVIAATKALGFVTLHRPSNVDDPDFLMRFMATMDKISEKLPLVFTVHPRTGERLTQIGYRPTGDSMLLVEPTGYLDSLVLQSKATVVVTDSGGLQEETTYLGTPCLTVRENTERPVTVSLGTNTLVGQDLNLLEKAISEALDGATRPRQVPPLWDGKAAERIADVVEAWGGLH